MDLVFSSIIKSLIFPPGIFLLIIACGILLLNSRPVMGKSVLWIGLLSFYLLSTPVVSDYLISQFQTYPALDAKKLGQHQAQAIVILAGGREKDAIEYGGDTVGEHTLVRCRYGAFLQRKTGLPILVSGGWTIDKEGASLAQVMAEVLRKDFNAGEVWLEENSRTTNENASFSKELLAQKGIDSVYLVTQAWHMPRSVAAFEKTGLKTVPAPTAFKGDGEFEFLDLRPDAQALHTSRWALHEMIGAIWYRIRH